MKRNQIKIMKPHKTIMEEIERKYISINYRNVNLVP